MTEAPEDQVERVVAEVREAARRRRGASGPDEPASLALQGEIARDLGSLYDHQDVVGVPFTSHRRISGSLVVFAKRMLHRLLTPILERQAAYNAANARLAEHLAEELRAARRQQTELARRLEALEEHPPGDPEEGADPTDAPRGDRPVPPALSRSRRRLR